MKELPLACKWTPAPDSFVAEHAVAVAKTSAPLKALSFAQLTRVTVGMHANIAAPQGHLKFHQKPCF
jgi:hypothetical protein